LTIVVIAPVPAVVAGRVVIDEIVRKTVPRMPARRFPPPWTVEEYNDACFIVRDHNGQQLAYVYFEDEPGRRSVRSYSLKMRREGLRPISKLPELPDR
jgi:hypothetical protein